MYHQFVLEGRFMRKPTCYTFKGSEKKSWAFAYAVILTSNIVNRDNGMFYTKDRFFPVIFRGEFAEIADKLLVDDGLYVFEGELEIYEKPYKFMHNGHQIYLRGLVLLCYKVYASKRKEDSVEFQNVNALLLHKPSRAPKNKSKTRFDMSRDQDLTLLCKKPHILREDEKEDLIQKKFDEIGLQQMTTQESKPDLKKQELVDRIAQSYRLNLDPEDF